MTLVLLEDDSPARVIVRVPEGEATREAPLRDLIFADPAMLPLHEVDPGIGRVVSVATELTLPGAGIIDLLLIGEHGRLIVVECKLWRNPQARREVVGQVLNYAGELARLSYEGLQRVISSRLKRPGNILHQLVSGLGGVINEAALVDRIERDLAAGRFQLLIVGDGITEGAQRIGAFLTRHAGLAFDLALIEMAEYRYTDPVTQAPRSILHPRILAPTAVIERHVIRNEAPGIVIEEIAEDVAAPVARGSTSGGNAAGMARWRQFVAAFVAETRFDDPAQMPPRIGGLNWMKLPLVEGLHLTLFRSNAPRVGAQVRFGDAEARAWFAALAADRDEIAAECVADGLPVPIWTDDGGTTAPDRSTVAAALGRGCRSGTARLAGPRGQSAHQQPTSAARAPGGGRLDVDSKLDQAGSSCQGAHQAMSRRTGLSQFRITLHEQCPRRLWLSVHRPELAEEIASTRAGFAVGHEVGDIACALHPDGYLVSAGKGHSAATAETASLLRGGWSRPLFEATFVHDEVLVRVDLMLPTLQGWHVAEVKSTTGVKVYHLGDLATQPWVMRREGVPVASAAIRHIDRDFMLTRASDYHGLFADTPIGDAIEPFIAGRGAIVAAARATLDGAEPDREVGAHRDDPFTCFFKGHCGRDMPPSPEWPVEILSGTEGKRMAREWQARGIDNLLQVPADAITSPKLARVHAATLNGRIYHDPAAISAETCDWSWPRIFLDFETIQFAIPHWVGTRPFQQIPFQFSAHIVDSTDETRHAAFLSLDGADPRRACAEALARLPATGAVLSWHASFERGCLLVLAAMFADLRSDLTSLAERLIDLLPVVRRHYYHRDMRGSWSIKAVLPTIAAELGYDTLEEVRSGTDAQLGHIEAVRGDAGAARREVIRQALKD